MSMLTKLVAAGAFAAAMTAGAAGAVTFTFNSNGGDGTGVNNGTAFYDFSTTLVSNDNGVGGIYTVASAVADAAYEVIGVWQYSTADINGSFFDPFGYFVGSLPAGGVQLTVTDPKPPAFQSGTFQFTVQQGQTWGFWTLATDGILSSSTSIAYGDLAPVPVPAAGFLLIGALGGLVALRRRKTA